MRASRVVALQLLAKLTLGMNGRFMVVVRWITTVATADANLACRVTVTNVVTIAKVDEHMQNLGDPTLQEHENTQKQ